MESVRSRPGFLGRDNLAEACELGRPCSPPTPILGTERGVGQSPWVDAASTHQALDVKADVTEGLVHAPLQ